MPERARVPLVMMEALALAVLLSAGSQLTAQHATPGPQTFDSGTVMKVPLDTILKFAKDDLQFDSVLGAADSQPVDFTRGQIGTRTSRPAWIQPEMESYAIDTQALARGRIIARIWSSVPVPNTGLGPWWTYWWVDRKGPRHSWRSVFIPENKRVARVQLPDALELDRHPSGQWRQGIARFWVRSSEYKGKDPISIQTWGTCGGCCKQSLIVAVQQ